MLLTVTSIRHKHFNVFKSYKNKTLLLSYTHQHMSQTHISIRHKHTPAYVTNTLMCLKAITIKHYYYYIHVNNWYRLETIPSVSLLKVS